MGNGQPRPANSYRAARRNDTFRPDDGLPGVWRGTRTRAVRHPPVRLNRSRRWMPKRSYGEAT